MKQDDEATATLLIHTDTLTKLCFYSTMVKKSAIINPF